MATKKQPESQVSLFERAMAGATNEQVIEMTTRAMEELVYRVEVAGAFAAESRDRDVVNEARAFTADVLWMLPWWQKANPRLKSCWYRVSRAESRVEGLAGRDVRASLDGEAVTS